MQNSLGKTIAIKYAQGYSGIYRPERRGVKQDTSKPDTAMINQAVALAKTTDMAILFVGGNRDYESEGRDRKDLSLPL